MKNLNLVSRILLIAFLGTGVIAARAADARPEPDTPPEARTLRHDGKDRSYLIWAPQRRGNERHPVILLLSHRLL